MSWGQTLSNDRAAGVVLHEGNIILIHRIRDGHEYWVIPGGSVEEGETAEEAVDRELNEELGITVLEKGPLFDIECLGRREYFFKITKFTGIPTMGGPELERMTPQNHYSLDPRNPEELAHINLLPEGIAAKILEHL